MVGLGRWQLSRDLHPLRNWCAALWGGESCHTKALRQAMPAALGGSKEVSMAGQTGLGENWGDGLSLGGRG